MQKQTTVIIGAGLAGLVCGIILAKHGHNVTLVEQAEAPGPVLRGFKRQGVHFDTGLHYTGGLGKNGPLTRYLHYLGLETLPIVPFEPDCFDEVRFTESQRTFCLPVGFEQQYQALVRAFPQEERAISTYMQITRRIYLSSAFLSFQDSVLLPAQEPAWQQSLASFLHDITANEELKTVLSLHCLLYGVSPSHISLLQHARVAGSYHDSVHSFTQGGLTLVQLLVQQLEQQGVTILCKKKMCGSTMNSHKQLAEVLLEDGTQLAANTVLFTGNPRQLPDLLPQGSLRPALQQHLQCLEDTISALILFGKSIAPVQALHGKNVFLCNGKPLSQAFLPTKEAGSGPFYVTGARHSIAQNMPCAQGVMAITPLHASMFADVMHLPRGSRRSAAYKQQKQQFLDTFQKALVAAMPELEEVQFIDGATPLTLKDYVGGQNGGLYGCAHSLQQLNPLPVTRIPNLFLAGQSIIAPGVLGVVISAFLACSFIVGHKKLFNEVIACERQ